MTAPRPWLAAILVFVSLVLQVTVVTRIPFPGGLGPDLVVLVTAAWAVRAGPTRGCVVGFCAGLAADIVPPAYHAIGQSALVYCVVGYLVGLLSNEVEDSAVLSSLAVAAGALAATLLYAAFGTALGDPRVSWAVLGRVLPGSVVYDVIVAPAVWYVVARLVDRVTPPGANRSGRRLRTERTA